MRSDQDIVKIKSRFTEPYSIYGFLSEAEITHLVNIFNSNNEDTIKGYQGKIKKNTGPITLNLEPFLKDPIIEDIFAKLKLYIGDFELNAGFFFKTDYPHIIHNDDTFDLKDVYKGITIPLELEGDYTELPKLCFFDQCYFQGPAKFFKGDQNIPTYYNKQLYEYSTVDGIVNTPFDLKLYNDLFTHIKPKWLEGLSLYRTLEWRPTSALIFDSVRLHCASDFRQQGVNSKLGLSIFTRKP
jgi:hypothetical protein